MGRPGEVRCANPDCSNTFVPKPAQKYCTYNCGDKLRAKKYRDSHVAPLKERRRLHRQDNKEVLAVRYKRWAAKNKEHIRRYNRDYAAKRGREELNSYAREWYRNNRERALNYLINRKAAKRVDVSHIITQEDWEHMKDNFNHKCFYCGAETPELTKDHLVPLSKGGTHTYNNIVPACKPCNSSKSDRDLGDFLADILERGIYAVKIS